MEELKNENVTEQPVVEEPVVEQRPSTKYGRTAYQQQLQEEQAAQGQSDPVQQYQQYTPYQEVLPEVKSWPAYVLMALVAIATVVNFVTNVFLSQAYTMGNNLEEVIDATLALSEHPTVLALSTLNDVIFIAMVACLVIDIMQLHKAGKKIGGAIAFAILLRPAYFIWRAHLLGQKKALPIIYAIVVYLVTIAQFGVLMSASMEMVMRTML